MKKRVLCIVLALCILFALTACSTPDQPTSAPSENVETTEGAQPEADAPQADEGDAPEGASDAPNLKIGFSYWSNTDLFGAQMYNSLKKSVEAVGGEFVYLDWATIDLDGMIESYQNLIEAGCNGLIVTFLSPAVLEMCEEKGVSIMLSHGSIGDEGLAQMANESSVFVGQLMADDYQAGVGMAQGLKDAGCTKIAYTAFPQGQSPQHDERIKGAEDFIAEDPEMEIVTNYRGAEVVEGIRQMLTAYPEIDGLVLSGNDGAGLGTIYSDGLQDRVKVASVDFQEDTGQHLEDGTLVWIAGGHATLVDLSFALLYNHMTGHDMIADKTEKIVGTYVYVTNGEEFDEYMTYYEGDIEGDIPVYTADEIRGLLVEFNPDATLEDIQYLAENNTLDNIKERHADLF